MAKSKVVVVITDAQSEKAFKEFQKSLAQLDKIAEPFREFMDQLDQLIDSPTLRKLAEQADEVMRTSDRLAGAQKRTMAKLAKLSRTKK